MLLFAELAGARQKDREVNERTFHTWMNVRGVRVLVLGWVWVVLGLQLGAGWAA